tara:strand:+ start:3270 stop:3422 length:153 start_codon:yes stop_codon:yes gene_type:complete
MTGNLSTYKISWIATGYIGRGLQTSRKSLKKGFKKGFKKGLKKERHLFCG